MISGGEESYRISRAIQAQAVASASVLHGLFYGKRGRRDILFCIKAIQLVIFYVFNELVGIAGVCSIACLLKAVSPALVICRVKVEEEFIPLAEAQEV